MKANPYSGLYPQAASLADHHSALHKQAGQIVGHGNALLSQLQRIEKLESSEPLERLAALEKEVLVQVTQIKTTVRIAGIVWTLALVVLQLLPHVVHR